MSISQSGLSKEKLVSREVKSINLGLKTGSRLHRDLNLESWKENPENKATEGKRRPFKFSSVNIWDILYSEPHQIHTCDCLSSQSPFETKITGCCGTLACRCYAFCPSVACGSEPLHSAAFGCDSWE